MGIYLDLRTDDDAQLTVTLEGEPGSPWDELASYLRAVVALLRGEPIPSVPAAYAAHLAAIQEVHNEE